MNETTVTTMWDGEIEMLFIQENAIEQYAKTCDLCNGCWAGEIDGTCPTGREIKERVRFMATELRADPYEVIQDVMYSISWFENGRLPEYASRTQRKDMVPGGNCDAF